MKCLTKRKETGRSISDLPPKPRKKIAHRAKCCEYFIQREDDPGQCNCCFKTVGTSPMINHIARCKLYKADQESKTQTKLTGNSSGPALTVRYDAALFRRSVNEMIILSALLFAFVESEGFMCFCLNVLPMYTVHCRRTATKDIFARFVFKKQRVSLTTDIWVAPTNSVSYMVVTSRWIDANWVLQKMILSFKPVTDHKEDTIAEHLISCLAEWGIEKVFTVTGEAALVKNGVYLHMRCSAHILNLMYVRSSGPRLKSFELRVDSGKISRGSLSMDCTTRWNSTYLMLTDLYNEYFLELDENGLERVGPPISSSWDEVQRFVKFLRMFFNCTLVFSASKTVTLESNRLKSSIKSVMQELYDEYVLLSKSAGCESAATGSEHADFEQPSVVFDLSNDDEYERMDSLYSEMVKETAYDEISSELDI
ncbi:hypothetical protein N665_0037s0034 [Sinapis alba]|nr:hypothetical protein N665_0037s0034 [Sinapis alba]